MATQLAEQAHNVTVLESATTQPPPLARTRQSIDPQISIAVKEIDPQSSQYSCEVTIANVADEEFSVMDVGPRLTRGVRLKESIDSAEAALSDEHREICRTTGALLTNSALLSDPELATRTAEHLREQMHQVLKPKSILQLYYHLVIYRRYPDWVKAARDRSFKILVKCAKDAENALKKFPLDGNSVDRRLIELNIDHLKAIEDSDDFDCSRCRDVALKKGQQYTAIYVVSATRGQISPNSYCISFDIKLRRHGYVLSRVAYATLTVPTGYLWTTFIAVISALSGWMIQALAEAQSKKLVLHFRELNPGSALLVMLTAAIVYNIFDMTTLRDKAPGSRNWRTAVFIGFLCGFLNQKILQALGALLG